MEQWFENSQEVNCPHCNIKLLIKKELEKKLEEKQEEEKKKEVKAIKDGVE